MRSYGLYADSSYTLEFREIWKCWWRASSLFSGFQWWLLGILTTFLTPSCPVCLKVCAGRIGQIRDHCAIACRSGHLIGKFCWLPNKTNKKLSDSSVTYWEWMINQHGKCCSPWTYVWQVGVRAHPCNTRSLKFKAIISTFKCNYASFVISV